MKKILVLGAVLFVVVAGYLLWRNAGMIRNGVEIVRTPDAIPPGEALPFVLPEGFAVRVFARDVPGVRVLTRDSRGVLVASLMSEGKVVALPDENGDGVADAVIPILERLSKPHGIVFDCPSDQDRCTLYVAEESIVRAYAYDGETRTVREARDVMTLPSGAGHSSRSLMLHPDGTRLLVSVGSSCNVCIEKNPMRASIYAVDLSTFESKRFARGLRNTVFMATNPVTGDVWGTDMGRDLLGDDTPPDEINIIREDGNYGWPICYGGNVHDTQFDKNTYIRNPCTEPFEIPSHIDIPAHSAPLGLAFVPEEGWPEEYWLDLLVAYHGSWNRSVPTGYKIVHIELDDAGNPTGNVSDFMTGFTRGGSVIGRPVALLAEPGGILYVSDDRAGVVYRITGDSK